MIKEAIEMLLQKGKAEQVFKEINGETYTNVNISKVSTFEDVNPSALKATTLTSLVDYIKSGYDKKATENLIIQVLSPEKVVLYSELKKNKEREAYVIIEAILPKVRYSQYMDMQEFNIMVQSNFIRTDETANLLKIVGNIKETVEVNSVDDGISQTAVVKTGVSSLGKAILPEQVSLVPYRTFPEVIQPKSSFILRLEKGPKAALFESDGFKWKNAAMNNIKEYLKEELKEFSNIAILG